MSHFMKIRVAVLQFDIRIGGRMDGLSGFNKRYAGLWQRPKLDKADSAGTKIWSSHFRGSSSYYVTDR